MMNEAQARELIARWEDGARDAAAKRHRISWGIYCQWIHGAEMVLEISHPPHAEERIPFPEDGDAS